MMNMNELSNVLLHYGRVTSDISFTINEMFGNCTNYYTRVRTFIYNGKPFYHVMVNGEVKECFELK